MKVKKKLLQKKFPVKVYSSQDVLKGIITDWIKMAEE